MYSFVRSFFCPSCVCVCVCVVLLLSRTMPPTHALGVTATHNSTGTHTECGDTAILELHEMFDLYAGVMTLCAFVGVLNYHKVRFPVSISLSLCSLALSLSLIGIDGLVVDMPIRTFVVNLLARSEFAEIILDFGVGFILFAAAMESDIRTMGQRWGIIAYLSVFGVFASVVLVGGSLYGIFIGFGFFLPSWHNFLICLLFGSIVSSTDSHRFVLDALTSANAPASISAIHLGESLFNDGVSVLLFIIFKKVIDAVGEETVENIWQDVARDILGGFFIGVLVAMLFGQMMKQVRQPNLNTLLSIVLVLDVTMIANRLESSAPMACAAAGLVLRGYFFEKLERRSQQELDIIWVFTESTLSGVFFLLIGFTIVSLPFSMPTFFASLVAIPIVMIIRYATLNGLLSAWGAFGGDALHKSTAAVLTWGGIRGGASVALAMSLNNYEGRETIFSMTYAVVLFSLIVQGLSLPSVFHWLYLPEQYKRRGSMKMAAQKDEMLNRLVGAVENSPQLAALLESRGIDTESLSRMSEHSESDSRASSPAGSFKGGSSTPSMDSDHRPAVGNPGFVYAALGEPVAPFVSSLSAAAAAASVGRGRSTSRLLGNPRGTGRTMEGYGTSSSSAGNPPRRQLSWSSERSPALLPQGNRAFGRAAGPSSHRSNNDEPSPMSPFFQQQQQQQQQHSRTESPLRQQSYRDDDARSMGSNHSEGPGGGGMGGDHRH